MAGVAMADSHADGDAREPMNARPGAEYPAMPTLEYKPFPPQMTHPEPAAADVPVGAERRRHHRTTTTRPAKVFMPGALRYAGSETSDISAGGALLRVDRARTICEGDRVDVAVASSGQPVAVLESKHMIPARVVRVIPIDHFHQAVAIEYDAPVTMAS